MVGFAREAELLPARDALKGAIDDVGPLQGAGDYFKATSFQSLEAQLIQERLKLLGVRNFDESEPSATLALSSGRP